MAKEKFDRSKPHFNVGTIGHIEDVAVHPNHEGKGVGSAVVRAIVELARQSGCYKVILS